MISSTCEQERGGWTLVARVQGMSGDFSPTSPLWANEDVVSPWDAADLTRTTSMKNPGWFSVPNQVVRVCYSGPRSECATFTHNRGLTLTQFFGTQFAVEVQEEYTFESLMKKFGKHLDLGHLKTVSIIYFIFLILRCLIGLPRLQYEPDTVFYEQRTFWKGYSHSSFHIKMTERFDTMLPWYCVSWKYWRDVFKKGKTQRSYSQLYWGFQMGSREQGNMVRKQPGTREQR